MKKKMGVWELRFRILQRTLRQYKRDIATDIGNSMIAGAELNRPLEEERTRVETFESVLGDMKTLTKQKTPWLRYSLDHWYN